MKPKYSKISALPDTPETERLPCFATYPPDAATTNDAAVEMLNVFILSPPVPHMSIIFFGQFGDIWTENSFILSSIPKSSSSVSPFLLRLCRNVATISSR